MAIISVLDTGRKKTKVLACSRCSVSKTKRNCKRRNSGTGGTRRPGGLGRVTLRSAQLDPGLPRFFHSTAITGSFTFALCFTAKTPRTGLKLIIGRGIKLLPQKPFGAHALLVPMHFSPQGLKRLNAFLLYLNCMFFHRTTGDSSSFRDSSFTLRWKADIVRRVSYPKTQPGLELRPLYSQSSPSTTLPLRLPFSVKIKHRKRRHNGFYAKNRMNDNIKLTFVHIRTTCELSYTI